MKKKPTSGQPKTSKKTTSTSSNGALRETKSGINTSKNELTAYVSPRSLGGISLFSGAAKIDKEHVGEFKSEPRDLRVAVGKLDAMGFQVKYLSELSIRITGSAKLFEKHMGLQFERRETQLLLPTEQTRDNCLDLGSEVFDGMVFPQPLELHGKKKTVQKKAPAKTTTKKKVAAHGPLAAALSATPPALGYHHLAPPHDIASAMNASVVHAAGNKGEGIRAAMIDSGFHWSHPYFSGKGYDLEVALPAGSDLDASGHGTGESANFLAVAPKTKLYGLSMDDAIASFVHARQNLGVRVISNSWGSRWPTDGPMSGWDPYWSLVLAEIALCAASGIIVLFSGGNGGMSVTASSPDTISVGGVYMDEHGALFASDYASSFDSFRFPGQHVPEICGLCGQRPRAIYIALPVPSGCQIDRDLGGSGSFPNKDETTKTDGWAAFSGTSAACPMVAGVVSLILSAHPQADLAEVRRRLYLARDVTQGSSSMGDAAGPGYDAATGHGLVDAAQAVA